MNKIMDKTITIKNPYEIIIRHIPNKPTNDISYKKIRIIVKENNKLK